MTAKAVLTCALALLTSTPTGVPRTTGRGDNDTPIHIEATHLAVDSENQTATYSDNVTATRGTTTIRCQILQVAYDRTRRVRRIEASKNVVASDKNLVASGTHAVFDNVTGILEVTGSPRIEQVDGVTKRIVYGERVTFEPSKNRATVFRATTQLKGDTKQSQMTIESDTLDADGTKDTAHFIGHVVARRGGLLVKANEMTARSNAAGEIDRVFASGQVEATEGDKWAKGKQASYDASLHRLVLVGAPEARIGTTRLKGSRVTFLTDRNLVDVENASTIFEVKKPSEQRPIP
jgi:lipopolysaccharide transport protein LptA